MHGSAVRGPSQDAPTVFVVDDEENMRLALQRLLRASGLGVELFASGADLFARADLARAGCLLVDMHMPDMHGLEVQACLLARGVAMPVLFLTGTGNVGMAVSAMREGAVDFIEKPFDGEDLVARLRRAIAGDASRRSTRGERDAIQARLATLTPRERSVLDLVARGNTSKQVARALGSSPRTIEVHRRHLMEKMAAPTLADLVRMRLADGDSTKR